MTAAEAQELREWLRQYDEAAFKVMPHLQRARMMLAEQPWWELPRERAGRA